MPRKIAGKWEGGRVALVDGREAFYIRKRVGRGVRREIVVADNLEDARAELALFKRDPVNYQSPRERIASAFVDDGSGAVRLDGPTVDAFLEWCDTRVAKGDLTEPYVKQTLAPYLSAWMVALGGRDLHRVNLDVLKHALKRWSTAKHKRVVALKAFSAWAREEKDAPRLRRRDDPTLDLKTPPIIAAKSVRAKGYPMKLVERVYAALVSQAARDTLCLRAKLGLHDSEIARVARGDGVLRPVDDPAIAGVIVFAHLKAGKQHAVSCDAQTFAAAERLQARGRGLSRNAMKTMVDRACARIGVDGLRPGELRHSFATWAVTVGEVVRPADQRGAELDAVREHMGHLSKRTTSVFYVGDRVPNLIRLPLRLEHPEDPAVLPGARFGQDGRRVLGE